MRSTRPGEGAIAVGIAAVVVAIVTLTLVAAWLFGSPVGGEALLHAGLLGLLVVVAARSHRVRGREARALVTAVAVIGAMFFLYGSLGRVAFVAVPWDGDRWVRSWDRALFLGVEPVAWLARRLGPRGGWTELLSFFYAAFIPYLYLSIFLSLVGRPPRVRTVFVTAFALLYGASFMGYLFVPARGPIVSMADVLGGPLSGGRVHALIVRAVDSLGGPHGAFPSLHVGATSLVVLVDLRHGDALRGLIYIPFLLLVCLATVALRYHYVVDLVTGAALAFAALLMAERFVGRVAPFAAHGRPT